MVSLTQPEAPAGKPGRDGQRSDASGGDFATSVSTSRLSCSDSVIGCGVLTSGALAVTDRQHRAQHAVGAIGGDAFEPLAPGFHVQVFEFAVRIILRHVDGLRNRRIDVRRDRGHHQHMVGGGDFQCRDEGVRQIADIVTQRAIHAVRVIFHRVILLGAVGHAFHAVVEPRERRLDAVRRVVGERQRNGAGRRDRGQMRVADAVLADLVLQRIRQTRCKSALQIFVGIEQRERAAFLGQVDRTGIGGVAHDACDVAAARALARSRSAGPA